MESLRRRDVSPQVYVNTEHVLSTPPSKILDTATAYIPAFAESEWKEHHSLDLVAYRLVYDLTIGTYGSLSTLEGADGKIIGAGWEGGGLSSYEEVYDWVITSYEMTNEHVFPIAIRNQKKATVIDYMRRRNVPPESIMNVPDFFVVPEERQNPFHTANLMKLMTQSAYEHGITHYLVWTKYNSIMHDVMTKHNAEVVETFYDETEEHIIFGPLEDLIGKYLRRKNQITT